MIKDKKKIFPLLIQLILTIATIVLLILYLVNNSTMYLLQIVLGLTMLVTGYNNYAIYKRKFFTVIYFVLGLLLLVLAVLTLIGV